jgi:hypothetical protein
MRVTPLMVVTALVETATGLLLLAWPALVFVLLLGWRQAAPETLLIGRLAGAAVISMVNPVCIWSTYSVEWDNYERRISV